LLAALSAGLVVGGLAFDLMVVRPAVDRIENRLQTAAPGERQPSAAVMDMLHRAYGVRINDLVARDAVSSGQIESMGTLSRLSMELGIALLLPVHLSRTDIAAAYLTGAYMGPDARGFAAASRLYLGIELDRVDLAQAAKLVAMAHAPDIYRQSPERLERKAAQLLSRPSHPG